MFGGSGVGVAIDCHRPGFNKRQSGRHDRRSRQSCLKRFNTSKAVWPGVMSLWCFAVVWTLCTWLCYVQLFRTSLYNSPSCATATESCDVHVPQGQSWGGSGQVRHSTWKHSVEPTSASAGGQLLCRDINGTNPFMVSLTPGLGDSWSVTMWVYMTPFHPHVDSAVLWEVRGLQLKLTSTSSPVLVVTGKEEKVRYWIKPNRRGGCGRYLIKQRWSWSFDTAARHCTTLEGCSAFSRNKWTGATKYCQLVLTMRDVPGWQTFQQEQPRVAMEHALRHYTWYQLSVTVDDSTNMARLYINGLLKGEVQYNPSIIREEASPNGEALQVGASLSSPLTPPFTGVLCNLQLWDMDLQLGGVHESLFSNRRSRSWMDVFQSVHQRRHVPGSLPRSSHQRWDMGYPEPTWGIRLRDLTFESSEGLQQQVSPHMAQVVVVMVLPVYDHHQVKVILKRFSAKDQCEKCDMKLVLAVQKLNGCPEGDKHCNAQQPPGRVWEALPHDQHALGLARLYKAAVEREVGLRSVLAVMPHSEEIEWSHREAVLSALGVVREDMDYVLLLSPSLEPLSAWVTYLMWELDQHKDVVAAHSKVLHPDGTIMHYGYEFQRAYVHGLDKEEVVPVEYLQGYPMNYRKALEAYRANATQCLALLIRQEGVPTLKESLHHDLGGPEFICVDFALRWRSQHPSRWPVVVSPSSVMFKVDGSEGDRDPALLPVYPSAQFYEMWSAPLWSDLKIRYRSEVTTSWAMHCGGSMGNEAYNMMQGLEGQLAVRAQIIRGGRWCEHAKVLEGTPRSFSERIERLRRLSSISPSDILIHHKDYREVAWSSWPPGRSSSYLIGRYMHEVVPLPDQWVEQMKTDLDEVWVPSRWLAATLEEQGVERSKITVIPESIDVDLYDPQLWEPLPLPGRRKFAFLSVFKLEDRKGWKEMLKAYFEEFSDGVSVSLYIHTVAHPDIVYDRETIVNRMQQELYDTYKMKRVIGEPSDSDTPHVHIMGQFLTAKEMFRLYASVDAFILPSHGEGWGLPYMEAMALGVPCIATNWSGMTEFMNEDNSLMLGYRFGTVQSQDPWFKGAHWAEPDVMDIRRSMRRLVEDEGLRERLAQRARADIREKYHNDVLSRVIADRLVQIGEHIKARTKKQRELPVYSNHPVIREIDETYCPSLDFEPPHRPRTRAPGSRIRLALVSSWPPRPCGVGTFARNLLAAMLKELPKGSEVDVYAMLKDVEMAKRVSYDTDPLVKGTILMNEHVDYEAALHQIHREGYHAVLIQHEYGLYGNCEGAEGVCLARQLKVPVVAVVHTLSDNLNDIAHLNVYRLADSVGRLVVMSSYSRNCLSSYHGIPPDRVTVIPHGVPVIAQDMGGFHKAAMGWHNRTVLLTNGLIHPGKGIEHVLKRFKQVVAAHPEVLYVVHGQAHPACQPICGDYHRWLQEEVVRQGLQKHVIFKDEFAPEEELLRLVQAVDIYIAPYNDRITSNSGTVSMAMAAGKLVVATPFEHAREVLPGRGILVNFEDAESIYKGIMYALSSKALRQKLGTAAYQYTRKMSWSRVAQQYGSLLDELTAVTPGADLSN